MIALAIEIEAGGWGTGDPDLPAWLRRAAEAAVAALDPGGGPLEATLLLTDDAAIRDLNRRWRGQDKATNVLSFPAPALPGSPRPIGDVVIAWETVTREAEAEGKSVAAHAAHLVIHGVLHLLGQDHEDVAEAEAMEAVEVAALARIGVADPYREPA